MQLAKATLPKTAYTKWVIAAGFIHFALFVSAQSNSPYSRFGLGDLFPQSNITTRGMGGITAAYADPLSINFSNPASYGSFQTFKENKTNKVQGGRMILDVGINLENRTLIAPNTPKSFTSSDALFSYVQVGIPLRHNWGLTFGLRPLSKVSYSINRYNRLFDSQTGQMIDSAYTEFNGNGGAFLPTIGTGFRVGRLSAGVNMGYLFGNRETATRRAFINDTVTYYASNSATNYSFGGLFFQGGLQYLIDLKKDKFLRLGVSGNWQQDIGGSRDVLRQTYTLSQTSGELLQIDSVFEQKDIKGNLIIPASYTAGFVVGREAQNKTTWQFGLDYTTSQWSNYRFFDQRDSTSNSWKLAAGGMYRPVPGRGYFSSVEYRFGLHFGKDYIQVQRDLPVFGASIGVALPIRSSRVNINQFNRVNLAFEFIKRGTQENALRENLYRLSVGFSLTDLWFIKRKYD